MVNLDILVIGGGTAGEDAAKTARRNVDKVGVIEKGALGGDCIFHACIPTKAMVHAARAYKKMRSADFFGLPTIGRGVNYKKVKAFKDKIVADTATGRDERLTKLGISLFKGKARFISPHEVTIGDEIIKADKIIITTGSQPAAPPIPGLKETGYITNIEALELESVPERLAIVGGGPVGVEFAQIFAAFGAKVHIYEGLERILSGEDEDISQAMIGLFAKQGISVSTSVKVSEVGTTSSAKLVVTQDASGKEHKEEYNEIMIAAGRKPAIDDLDLAAAGIESTRRGITVNASLQTSLPHIWAAGDATGTFAFTLIAWEQGDVAAINATTNQHKELDYRILPRVTFCDPEVASVGLTEKQAQEQGYRVKAGKFDFANIERAILSDETDGFIKIVAEQDSGLILGGHIVGVEASSLIHEIAASMVKGMTAADIGNTFHAFPTLSEGVRYACQAIM